MDVPQCPGCAQRDVWIAQRDLRIAELESKLAALEKRLADLEARFRTNSSNSSTPPSANPLGAPVPVKKKKSKRRRGGQPGHDGHLRELLPPERVNKIEVIVPSHCCKCDTKLPATAGPSDPPPVRFQKAELPPIAVAITEYQGHARTCPACGEVTRAVIPAEIRAHAFGPRLVATLSYFSGCHGMSKRGIEETCEVVFGVPIALGTVSNLEQEVSAALAAPHQQALQAVQQAEVKYADETSWKKWGQKCWLWAAATKLVAAFVIHAHRNVQGMASLLGSTIAGYLHSDRWTTYHEVSAERRQICWAHLKRDFQKLVDQGGVGASIGRRGKLVVKRVFAAWHAFQDGKATREQLGKQIDTVQACTNRLLIDGAFSGDARVTRFCENLLHLEDALWTFARVEGVEPTNNFMERLMRLAVLWRRRSFGCNSDSGCRFVERILTVVQTCRLQKRSVLEYLCQAVHAQRNGQNPPKLA